MMATRYKAEAEAAMQYLIWAIEQLEKTGEARALLHARAALDQLHSVYSPSLSLKTKRAVESAPP